MSENFKPSEAEAKAEELNAFATKKINYIVEHKYFDIIREVDKAMANNKDVFNKGFYMAQQDKVNEAYGEILIAFGKLRGKLKTYIAIRKFQKMIEYDLNRKEDPKFKIPGDSVLEDIIKSEVPDLYNARLVIEAWKDRAENTIKTARNHTYGDTKSSSEEPD